MARLMALICSTGVASSYEPLTMLLLYRAQPEDPACHTNRSTVSIISMAARTCGKRVLGALGCEHPVNGCSRR